MQITVILANNDTPLFPTLLCRQSVPRPHSRLVRSREVVHSADGADASELGMVEPRFQFVVTPPVEAPDLGIAGDQRASGVHV